MREKKRRSPALYIQIIAGMFLGIGIGFAALQFEAGRQIVNDWIVPWGKLFIRLLKLVAIPLLFVSLVKGLMGLESFRSFSRLGKKTLVVYIATTIVAVLTGLSVGLVAKPGNLVDQARIESIKGGHVELATEKATVAEQKRDRGPLGFMDEIVPENIVDAASNNSRMLQVIFFALLFGLAALSIPKEKTTTVVSLFDGLNDIIFRMIGYIIACAPIGVTALMAGLVVSYGGDMSIFAALGAYALCVAGAMLFMLLLFYPALVHLFSKTSIGKFMKALYPVQLFAFTTSSSAVALPLNMEAVEKKLGVSKETTAFVLPVGTTVNMDGTSCYQVIAILFIAQVLAIDLSLQQLFVVMGMTILSSIGTPAIPGGSFVMMTIVLTSVGIPPEGLALIIGIDRPLDMLRSAVNVTGDAVIAVIVDGKQCSA